MTTQFENELVKIDKKILFQIFKNLFECLEDGKYNLVDSFISKDDVSSFEKFTKVLDNLKLKKMIARQDHLKIKRATTSGNNKKSKLDSIPEQQEEKKKRKRAEEMLKESRKYHDPDLSSFEICLTFLASRLRIEDTKEDIKNEKNSEAKADAVKENLLVFFSQHPQIGKPALDDLEEYLISFDEDLGKRKKLMMTTTMVVKEGKEGKEGKEVALTTYNYPEKITNIILISSAGLTPTALTTTIPLMRRDYNIQIFLHTNLMFNVTKHKLVKKHRRINGEERKELMKKFHLTNLTLDRLPCITIDDPLSLWHDFRVGEIIRIEEPGMSEKYRIVVDHPPT